jgi:hypothetical protein
LRDLELDEESPETSLTGNRTDVNAGSSLVNVDLGPELIKKLTIAAKASGQSTTDWIYDAIAEAISRRSERKTH